MTTSNLKLRSLYKIVELKEVKTKFGNSYILIDSEYNKYWANKKIGTYIKTHQIPLSNNGKVLFKIKTYDYKTFKNDLNEEITFLQLNLFK